jgi:uncharacterized membrane protein
MNINSDIEHRFSWGTFVRALLIQIGILALFEWYWYKSSGGWQSSSLVVIVVFAWINAFGAWRWRQIRQTLKNGTFSEDEYRANATAFYLGSRRQRCLVIAVGVAILFLWAIYDTVEKQSP